jgi:hypothetical protein
MIIASIFAGFLSTMNVFVDKYSDIRLHLNDLYMILLMLSWMIYGIINVTHHSNNKSLIIVVLVALIAVIIYCIRKQVFINDYQFLNGMIPDHSMAITMDTRIKEKTKDQ